MTKEEIKQIESFVFLKIEEYENRFSLINSDEFDENIYKNNFEKQVADEFRALGHKVVCGDEIAGLSVDLLVDDKFVIECDGLEDNVKSNISNMKKQAIIERCGLLVCRFSLREWRMSKEACANRMINYI